MNALPARPTARGRMAADPKCTSFGHEEGGRPRSVLTVPGESEDGQLMTPLSPDPPRDPPPPDLPMPPRSMGIHNPRHESLAKSARSHEG